MGEDFYEKSCDELLNLLHAMESDIGSSLNMIMPDWMPQPPAKRLKKARARVDEIFHDRLQERSLAPEIWAKSANYIAHTLNDTTIAKKQEFLPSQHTLLMFPSHTSTVASISWVIISVRILEPVIMAMAKANVIIDAQASRNTTLCSSEAPRLS